MRTRETVIGPLTDTSPASASTAVSATIVFKGSMFGFKAEKLLIDAVVKGGTSGTTNLYLQRKIAANSWLDFVSFPQVAAGATKNFSLLINGDGSFTGTIADVGAGTDAGATPSLAAGTYLNTSPCGDVRAVFVAGAGTVAGAIQSVTITPLTEQG